MAANFTLNAATFLAPKLIQLKQALAGSNPGSDARWAFRRARPL
jgi:hypothetical protein